MNHFKCLQSLKDYHHLKKKLKNYLKHKCKEMGVEDFILRLRIEMDNKLSKKRVNSFSSFKEIIMEQVLRFHNKNKKKKLIMKGKGIAKRFNEKYFIYNKIGHLIKVAEIKVNKGTQRSQVDVTEVDHLTN